MAETYHRVARRGLRYVLRERGLVPANRRKRLLKLERIPWSRSDAPGEGALREMLEKEGFEVVTWRDRCNWRYDPHAHEHDESLWVLRGRIVLRVAGEDFALGPGDRLMLPKETVHTASVGPDGALYLIGQRR